MSNFTRGLSRWAPENPYVKNLRDGEKFFGNLEKLHEHRGRLQERDIAAISDERKLNRFQNLKQTYGEEIALILTRGPRDK